MRAAVHDLPRILRYVVNLCVDPHVLYGPPLGDPIGTLGEGYARRTPYAMVLWERAMRAVRGILRYSGRGPLGDPRVCHVYYGAIGRTLTHGMPCTYT